MLSIKYRLLTATMLLIASTFVLSPAFASLGNLKEFIHTGSSNGWDGKIVSGEYWLENRSQEGAIRYYYTAYDGQSNQRTISTKVILNASDPYSQAGLLYGFDSNNRSYFLVNIGADGVFTVTHRDNEGFHRLIERPLNINPENYNKITIAEKGNELTFSVNNVKTGQLTHDAAGTGSVGIVAIGLGRFGFTDYEEQLRINRVAQTHNEEKPARSTVSTSLEPLDEPFKTHSIRDEFGFERPMEAMTIKMPESWEVKGTVQWYGKPTCAMDVGLPKVHLKGTAKNGMQWVEVIPGGIWGWNSNFDTMPQMAKSEIAGCDARRIVDIQTFVNQYIPTIRPNAQITSQRFRPDIIQEMMQEQGDQFAALKQQIPNSRLRAQAMEVNLTYNANGREVNELLIPIVLFVDQPGVDMYGGMSAVLTMAMAMGTVMTATVEGPADEKLLKTIGDTIVNNRAYTVRLQQHVNQRTQQMAQATQRQRAANRAFRANMAKSNTAKTYSDILDSNMSSWQKIQGMQNAGQSNLVDATLERTPWQTTYGETVYMPQQYQRIIQLPNGVFAGTNDNFFNPINGTELNPQRY